MKHLLLLALAFVGGILHAQVPQLINYQGKVAVGTTNFDGSGQFKFALVNATGSQTYWSNNGSSTAGSEPTAAVTLTVTKGLYSVLLGDATLTNMTVMPSTVFNNADVRLRVWFNDGTHGSQLLTPDQRIAAVGYAMMAGNVPDGAITSSKIASGAVGSAQIASGAVSSTHLSAGAVTSSAIAAGAVGTSQLADHAVQAANLASGAVSTILNQSGQTGLPYGAMIASPTVNPALESSGFRKVSHVTIGDAWETRTGGTSPSPRHHHTAVWTGSEMIIWGGYDATYGGSLATGARYNPSSNFWTPVAITAAPAARNAHTAVWTGSEMIIWGGIEVDSGNTGGRYNPTTDSWTALPVTGMPVSRIFHTMTWTGKHVVVWGGISTANNAALNSGGIWAPGAASWTAISTAGAPSPRLNHTAPVWDKSGEVFVWGGKDQSGAFFNDGAFLNAFTNTWRAASSAGAPAGRAEHVMAAVNGAFYMWGGNGLAGNLNDGARYHPGLDAWSPISATGAPSSRAAHTAVGTDSEMIVWGGIHLTLLGDGARYNPSTDSWTPVSNNQAPSARQGHTAVWTGSEMIIWGTDYAGTGGRYSPATDSWVPTAASTIPYVGSAFGPSERYSHAMVWTGSEAIIWGGRNFLGTKLNDGMRYFPATNAWLTMSGTNAPSARQQFAAVWTGAEMIVHGGYSGAVTLADGARYNPATDTWTAIATDIGRSRHAAVWTGTQMLEWGGLNGSGTALQSGRAYSPATNTWSALSSTLQPAASYDHTAVWTDTQMLVWGGYGSGGTPVSTGGRYVPSTNTWANISAGAPAARAGHTAVWTGTDMIVWGGTNGSAPVNSGARYNPTTLAWTALSTNTAPVPRSLHSAVWTGNEMLVWGGESNGGYGNLNYGGRYNPAADTWNQIAPPQASPVARSEATAVWTGAEMLVFGGHDSSQAFNDLMRFNPDTDSWSANGALAAPAGRIGFSTVWTGTEMIVWGGANNMATNYLNTGARYNPAANLWRALAVAGAPSPRASHSAVWTGTEMIIWGGTGGGTTEGTTGGRYNPATNTWTLIPGTLPNTPAARNQHSAIWTGTQMVVWGGQTGATTQTNTGGRFNPSANGGAGLWSATTLTNAPAARLAHTAVWTGSGMVIFGGNTMQSGSLNSGASYNPAIDQWTALPATGAPSARAGHTAIWTGTEMIVWGGSNTNDGARYNQNSNSWSALPNTLAGTPAARTSHSAVWSGGEMIIWGGNGAGGALGDGARFDPVTSTWAPTTTAGAPSPRSQHAAVWTGSQMLLWGGMGSSGDTPSDTFVYDPAQTMYLYTHP